MNNILRKVRVVLSAMLLCTGVAAQEEKTGTPASRLLRSTDVIDLAIENNPSLKAVVSAREKALSEARAAQGLYPFLLHADAGVGRINTPTGDSFYNRGNQVALGFGVSRTFSVGTLADVSLEGQWSESYSPQLVLQGQISPNPTVALSARLSVTQPLIRGFGQDVGLQPLREAQKNQTLAQKSLERSASELAAEVLRLYWELWLAGNVVQINERSRDIAQTQVEETAQRVTSGDAAPVDILAARTRVATLEEAVIEGRAEVARLRVVLAGSCGVLDRSTLLESDSAEEIPPGSVASSAEEILARALQFSPEIQEGFAALASAVERARNAGESTRQRLDLQTWIEARTMSVEDPSAAFSDFGERDALSAWVGLQYELPLDNRKKEGDRAAARYAVEIARNNLAAAENRVRTEVAAAIERLRSARQRLDTAQSTLALAQAQANAERERYHLGATIFTTVRDADESARQAELRVTRARVDIVKAEIALRHLDGTLLTQIALPE